jgi:ubiquinone/menaquinone biosynthesis C-methylase UbiE
MGFAQQLDSWIGRNSYRRVYPKLIPDVPFHQDAYANLLEQIITSETRWLDGGCGHQIADINPEKQKALVQRAKIVVGCDLFLSSLEKHRSIHKLVLGRLDCLPFADRSFNLVTLNMVVEHLTKPEVVFTEIARILEPGGKLVLLTPNKKGYFVRLNRIGNVVLPEKMRHAIVGYLEGRDSDDIFPTVYCANTQDELRTLFTSVGMQPNQQTLLRGLALFYFFSPACALELLLANALDALGARQFVSWNLLEVYSRQQVEHDSTLAVLPQLPVVDKSGDCETVRSVTP